MRESKIQNKIQTHFIKFIPALATAIWERLMVARASNCNIDVKYSAFVLCALCNLPECSLHAKEASAAALFIFGSLLQSNCSSSLQSKCSSSLQSNCSSELQCNKFRLIAIALLSQLGHTWATTTMVHSRKRVKKKKRKTALRQYPFQISFQNIYLFALRQYPFSNIYLFAVRQYPFQMQRSSSILFPRCTASIDPSASQSGMLH